MSRNLSSVLGFDKERSLSGGFRRSFALSVAPWAKIRSKRSHAAGFTLRYPLAQPAAAKSSVGGEKSERRRPAIRTSGFPAVGNFSRQASELLLKETLRERGQVTKD
jgi:hypothetical protein